MKRTILVVDDTPDDIVILDQILREEYHVKVATNGESALEIARSDPPPDLILLDIMMPDMDGFEVCRQLKGDSKGASIPVIFLTAKVMVTDEKQGFETGAVDYIRKPVDPDIVRARVKAQLEQKELSIRISEIRYRRLFEAATDGIMIVDTQTGGIIDVNPALVTLMGMSREAFLGKRVEDLEFLVTILEQRKNLHERQKTTYVRYKDLPLKTYDGRWIYVEYISAVYLVDHREQMQINIREITDLVEAEKQRDHLSERLTHYLSTSPTITYYMTLDQGRLKWRWVSENIRSILGYTPEEAVAPDWWFMNIDSSDRTGVLEVITDIVRQETASREYRFKKKDRSVVWLHDEMRLLPDKGDETGIIGTLTDISERKKAEEEILLKSAALEAAANAVIITDRSGIIKWVNPAFGQLTGYSRDEVVGKNPRELVWSGRQEMEFYRTLWNTILSGKVWSGRLLNRRKSGEIYQEEMTVTPVVDKAGYVCNFIAVKNDITDQVTAYEKLRSALRQKEELLREIHHRVNNNMQVIIGLMNLSTRTVDDALVRSKLEDITRSLYAMADIHEQFYLTDDISLIDFTVLLEHLIVIVKEEFPDTFCSISLSCGEGPALLGLNRRFQPV
jgi:PAS domain S-box-containing protein